MSQHRSPALHYQRVCIEAVVATLPPLVVTSEELEQQLAPVYERLGMPAGRLELMTGIRERRFFPAGLKPGDVSARTVQHALRTAQLDPARCGALLHGSVCRDQMEPATAAKVHHRAGLPDGCLVMDVSNACLGLLNGLLLIADMIELGRIEAGVVVGTELGRPLVDGTIHRLLADSSVTRKSFKQDFASLTIGSGSAAIVLRHADSSLTGNRLRGGAVRADTSSHELCAGGAEHAGPKGGLQMSTDSEALLHAGVNLAERTWSDARETLAWSNADVTRVVTHQVGKAHRQLLLERLGLSTEKDCPTVEFLGNTGAAALPTAAALALEQGRIGPGDRMAWLGIGSGLNCIMLGIDWRKTLPTMDVL